MSLNLNSYFFLKPSSRGDKRKRLGGRQTPRIKCLCAVTAVLLELPRIGEASSTLLARVQLLSRVDLHV